MQRFTLLIKLGGSSEFAINGTGIPDVDFDIGEAYAGRMSISDDLDGPDKLYFWFQPSPNPAASNEIVIWLNGGVSSYFVPILQCSPCCR